MTNQFQKHTSFSILVLFSLLFVFTSCGKDDDDPNNPYNGKTQVEFNPDLTYGTMVDLEWNEYKTIKIGNQTWMAENLRTTIFRNGEAIPTQLTSTNWDNAPITLLFGNMYEPKSIATYGRLYNWAAATDEREIAPDGWRVPTEEDWLKLKDYLIKNGFVSEEGTSYTAKSMATPVLWKEFSTESGEYTRFQENSLGSNFKNEYTNSSGFSAVPGGVHISEYELLYERGAWCSTSVGEDQSFFIGATLSYNSPSLITGVYIKWAFLSVRCIKE